jgi:uncharacterized membrane protein
VEWGLFGVLIGIAFWVGIVVLAVVLLKGELPRLQDRVGGSPALRLLEERYALGEITREEFRERRAVLTQLPQPPGAEPTEPLRPPPSA